MGKIVGIDLGTTNSVVCIAGEFGDFPKRNGATILTDAFGRTVHASAICECDGEVIYGDDAKYKAAEGYAPHRFWKRYMGRDMKYKHGGKDVRPQDLSRDLLVYLKSVAEKALGEGVAGAVITHPAYFGAEAIAATREAGDLAGLNVGPDGLMMEPIAAALAYLQNDPDPQAMRRVIVYDLGGGTFDVTVLERANGEYTPLSFDGDPELGGYNFDKALANHMLTQLRQQGYKIEIDRDAPEQNAKWAALMHYAEEAKIALSAPLPKGVKTDIRVPAAFVDDTGKPVRLAMTITREQFEKLIEPMVEQTIVCCRRALASARLDAGKLDHAILVGGSSRLPLVQRMLKTALGKEFEIDEEMVDACVAIGAALYAGRGARRASTGFQLDPRPPVKTKEPRMRIVGVIQPGEKVKDVTDAVVELNHDDEQDIVTVASDGRFEFVRDLNSDGVNRFALRATSAQGEVFAEHVFEVDHSYEAGPALAEKTDGTIGDIPTYLAKTIYVKTGNAGMYAVAEEGPPLPIVVDVPDLFTSKDGLPEITVRLFQEDQPLVDIPLKGFTIPVPKDTPISLRISVGKDYAMNAVAEIPSHSARTEVNNIRILVPVKPTFSQLTSLTHSLRGKLGEALANMPSGATKMGFSAECEGLLAEVEQQLQDAAPDVFRIERFLRNLERKLENAFGAGMDPTHREMASKFEEAHRLLPAAEAKDEKLREEQMNKTLEVLRNKADHAYTNSDPRAWSDIADQVDTLCNRFKRIIEGNVRQDLPPPPILQMQMLGHIHGLRQEAMDKGRHGDQQIQQLLDDAESRVKAVDVSSPNAQNDLIRIYLGPVKQVESKLGRQPSEDGDDVGIAVKRGRPL